MSGGTFEYVAAYRANTSLTASEFSNDPVTLYGNKYFDIYNSSTYERSYYKRILGDATGEMGPFYFPGRFNINKWYTDTSYFVESSLPWFHRGGSFNHGLNAGQFYFARDSGKASDNFSFRYVLSDHARS